MANLNEIKNKYKSLIRGVKKETSLNISINDDFSSEIFDDFGYKKYIPNKSALKLHKSNKFINLIMGPFGSGKSTACMFDMVYRACSMPKWHNNRRRSRWAIIRNTTGELVSTSLQTWLSWFSSLGDVKSRMKPVLTYEHSFNDGKGIVELEILFLALDNPKDVRKLKSLELTGAYINETSEISEVVLPILKGRLNGRYPSKSFCPEPYWTGIIADTNPPDEDHWLVRDFDRVRWMPISQNSRIGYEKEISEDYNLIKQPPGLIRNIEGLWIDDPRSDNHQNLSTDYYKKMASNQTEDFIKVYCLGEYGTVSTGKRVYAEYNDDVHSFDSLRYIEDLDLLLGWDFGLTPACIVCQISHNGQIRCLKEYIGSDMGIKSFAESIVIPGIKVDFPNASIGLSKADPAGMASNQGWSELSDIGVLNTLGIKTQSSGSNEISQRLSGVRFFLNKMIDGNPSILVSKTGCPLLRKGFIKGYYYKRIAVSGEERYREVPDKNEYSHIHDALQYILMFIASKDIKDRKISERSSYNEIIRPVMFS